MTAPGGGTQVDFDGMKQAAQKFGDGVNRCDRELKSFDSTVAALGSCWDGHTYSIFLGFCQELAPQFHKVIVSLDAMKDTLNGTEIHYSRNEYDAVTFVSPLSDILNGVLN